MCLLLLSILSFGCITGKLANLHSKMPKSECGSNVDRLIAIWQVIHENSSSGDKDPSWFDGNDLRDKDMGTFGIEKFHHDTPQDSLRPFRKNSSGHYWTSADVREVTALGYTYPELEKWNYVKDDGSYDRASHIDALSKYLNHNYNSASAAAEKAKITDGPDQSKGIKLASRASLTALTNQDPVDIVIDDYVVNVIYEKYFVPSVSVNGFTLLILVGLLSAEPRSRSTSL